MALTQVTGPYPIFTDLDGSPLDDGYLYIGAANQDPETNPIQVFWDSALTIPATQPIRTNNGYAWRNGTPGLLYTGGEFSITIRNKRNEFVLYSPLGYGFDPKSVSASVVKNDFIGNGITTNFTLSASPSTILATNIFINGVYQEKDSYNLSGNVIIFSIAPPLGSSIEILTNETGVINGGNANDISYTLNAPGATLQSVQTKLEQYISVKDFGAVGDGVTDDTAAFQAAVSSGAGRVYVPEGVYMVSDYIQISTPMTFFGDGHGLSTIKAVSGYTPQYWLLNIYNTSNVTIQGLTLDGNKTNNVGADYWLLEFGETSTVSNVTVRDVEMKNGPFNGVYVAPGASGAVFDNCLFEDNGSATGGNTHGAGIYLYLSEDVSFVNCSFVNNWEHGAYLNEGSNINVINCLFEANGIVSGLGVGQGLSYRSNYGSVTNCIMRGNANEGFRISASAAPNLNNVTASNNVIYDNQSADREVFISLASNVVFTDNCIGKYDGVNTPPRGLLIGTDPTNIKVSNNLIIGYDFSILVNASSISNLDISNNFILGLSGADIYGILFNSATIGDYISIRNNYIKGFTWSMGIASASFAVNNMYVADNYCVGFSSGQFFYPGGGTLGTPVYIERYKTTISASITGATVNAGTTSTATVTVSGYLGPTQINGSPPSALADGLLWSVAPASAPNTATVKITNVTGGPLSYSTGNWQFDVRSVVFD